MAERFEYNNVTDYSRLRTRCLESKIGECFSVSVSNPLESEGLATQLNQELDEQGIKATNKPAHYGPAEGLIQVTKIRIPATV